MTDKTETEKNFGESLKIGQINLGGQNYQIFAKPDAPKKKPGRKRKPLPDTYQGRFAANLLRLREAAGLSVEDAAKKIGTASKNIKNWETALADPAAKWIPLIAQAYGVEMKTLFLEK